jgi:GH24 family phage-related lysozyme (muramidase)
VSRARILACLLTVSVAGFSAWKASEGFTEAPVIPTKGDVPTVGFGSTKYEDGTPVTMADPPITRERGEILARNLLTQDEKRVKASIPGVKLHQEEFDLYMDFVGQYGVGNWRKSSMRARLLESDYRGACRALLLWKRAAGYDCSTPGNKRCAGVWTRQLARYEKCMAAQ